MAKTSTKKSDAKAAAAAKPAGLKQPAKKVKVRQQVKKGPHGGTMLVLVEDVAHLGKQGDMVEVKPGYARNYLVPNSLAIVPSEHNLKLLEGYKIKVNKAREAKIADLKVLAEQLTRLPAVTMEANAHEVTDDKGETHLLLYGSIGAAEISRTLKGKNLQVEPDMIRLEHPIREANTLTPVPLSLGYGIEASIQVLVVALQGAAKK